MSWHFWKLNLVTCQIFHLFLLPQGEMRIARKRKTKWERGEIGSLVFSLLTLNFLVRRLLNLRESSHPSSSSFFSTEKCTTLWKFHSLLGIEKPLQATVTWNFFSLYIFLFQFSFLFRLIICFVITITTKFNFTFSRVHPPKKSDVESNGMLTKDWILRQAIMNRPGDKEVVTVKETVREKGWRNNSRREREREKKNIEAWKIKEGNWKTMRNIDTRKPLSYWKEETIGIDCRGFPRWKSWWWVPSI